MKRIALLALGVVVAAPAFAQFSDGAENLGNYTVNGFNDSAVSVVNYGNMTVGSTNFSLPEAPNMIGGSAATTGFLMQANHLGNGAAASLNLILGSTPISFTGDYTLSFDVWMNAPVTGDLGGSTEIITFGVGRDNTNNFGYYNRTTGGDGTWGWAAGEGGFSSTDYAIFSDTTSQAGASNFGAPAQAAFPSPPYGVAGAPTNGWSTVDMVVSGGNVAVFHNGVYFWDFTTNNTDGFAMIGYDDPFNSNGVQGDLLWGVVDNVRVTAVPEPATMIALGAGLAAFASRRRRK